MDPEKVSCILGWETPKNVTDVQCFFGFTNFYGRFTKDYFKVVLPLTRMTKKERGKYNPFVRGSEQQVTFKDLKKVFTSDCIVHHFDYNREIVIETDALDYVSTDILSQYDDEGILHPVTFYSKKYRPVECNYKIYTRDIQLFVHSTSGDHTWRD
jgi:hypothetical protein